MLIKTLTLTLAALVIGLQYALWFGKSNVIDYFRLQQTVESLEAENLELQTRNDQLHSDVNEIKNRMEAIEARAREQLGLILPGETYYQIVDPKAESTGLTKPPGS